MIGDKMLPKIQYPTFKVEIPSTKKVTLLRPMLVKEEKILLMAKEADDNNSIMLAVKQVVNNCLVNNDIDVNELTLFDIDYLFIKIRANSVDSIIKVSYEDEEEDPIKHPSGKEIRKPYTFDINLNDVQVQFPDKKIKNLVTFGKDSGLKLKYPTAAVYESKAIQEADSDEKILEELVLNCLDSYFEGEKVYHFKDFKKEEIEEWLNGLNIPSYNKIIEWVENFPSVHYEIKYTNKKGTERVIKFSKLSDFFIF